MNQQPMVAPPKLLSGLVGVLVDGVRREVLLGDLEETFHYRLEQGLSLRVARMHYGREALASLWTLYISGTVFQPDPSVASISVASTPHPRSTPRPTAEGATIMRSWDDLRFSTNALLKRPSLSLVVVLAMALGIGASTLVFSVVEAALLRSLPVNDPASLMMVWNRQSSDVGSSNLLSAPSYADLKERANTLETVAAFGEIVVAPIVGTDQPTFARLVPVTDNFFEMLGVQPRAGRLFVPADGTPPADGAPPRAVSPLVISHDYWQREFSGSEDVIGRSLKVFSSDYQIVGVLPQDFRLVFPAAADVGEDLGTSIDLWSTWAFDLRGASRNSRSFRVVARKHTDFSLADVRGELNNIAADLRSENPELEESGFALGAKSFVAESGSHIRPLLWMLGGAVFCVLLVACVNSSGLLLARTTERSRELSVRAALGADRWRLALLSLSEALLLALAGGALGMALAWLGMKALAIAGPAGLPQADQLSLNVGVLGFAIALVLVCAAIAGLLPAARAMRHARRDSLNTRSSTATRRQRRLRDVMVGVQIALTVTLVLATGLLLRSLAELQRVPLGFEPENVLAVDISTVAGGFDRQAEDINAAFGRWIEKRRGIEQALSQSLNDLPGVEAAGAVFPVPLNGVYSRTCDYSLANEGRPEVSGVAYFRNVWPGYFESMQIPLLAGRDLRYDDDASGQHEWANDDEVRTDRPTVVIDSRLASELWPDEDAVGKTLRYDIYGTVFHDAEVVGVVPFVAQGSLVDQRQTIYIPRSYYRSQELTLTVRVKQDSPAMRASLVDAIHAEFPESPALIRPLNDYVDSATATNRFVLSLLGGFASIALLLAGIGIYGALALTVRQRGKEIGIHLAMGAAPRRVFTGMVRRSLTLSAIGMAAGVLLALSATSLISTYLYQVSSMDPIAVGGTVMVQCVVTLLACWIPARRASRVEPIKALRAD